MGRNVNPAFLPSRRASHLLGRLVFTLTRMISQPSLLNVGRPVSSFCKIRLVAVMFTTTMISMFLPMKLEERAGGHGYISTVATVLISLPTFSAALEGEEGGGRPTQDKKAMGPTQGHKTSLSSPLLLW